METVNIGVITVSDACSKSLAVDVSGKKLKEYIAQSTELKAKVTKYAVCPDELAVLKAYLVGWCREETIHVIMTTGGTGFTARDITPEVTRDVIEKEAPGFQQVMLMKSLEKTQFAAMSRGVCGIRGNKLIVNLPGSVKGALENYQFIEGLILHAVEQLQGKTASVKRTHAAMGNSHQPVPPGGNKDMKPKRIRSQVDVSRVADRPRDSPFPVIKMDAALEMVMAAVKVCPSEKVPAIESYGRFLAEEVFSPEAMPPFPASIKDGYAVIAADGSGKRKVTGASTAGDNPQSALQSGCCMRVSTGAPVPPGADAVVQVEDTSVIEASADRTQELEVSIEKAPRVGQDIRAVGSDVAVGQSLMTPGRQIGYAEIGTFCALGVQRAVCHRQPCVGILSTGNEVVDICAKPGPGQIRDSNRILLTKMLGDVGCSTTDLGIAPDDPNDLLAVLMEAMKTCDVIVSSGGVSMGEKDLLKSILLEDLKATIHFGRVFMKPGKPTTFATINKEDRRVLFFALPGNPVSAAVTCLLFVVPALRAMLGSTQPGLPVIKARLQGAPIALDPRPEYHRAHLTWHESTDGLPKATSTGNQLSSRLMSVSGANALLILPPKTAEKTRIEENEVLDAMIISSI